MVNKSEAKVLAKTKIPISRTKYCTIVTYEAKIPRMILPQYNTHRALSKSASSGRAIPGKRYRKILTGYMPNEFPRNSKGMKPKANLEGLHKLMAICLWKLLYWITCAFHQMFMWIGVHKEILNRILDAFAWVHVITTTTHLKNLFALRIHPDAQFQFKEAAEAINEAVSKARASVRHIHLPLITIDDICDVVEDFKVGCADDYALTKTNTDVTTIEHLVLGRGSKKLSDYRKISPQVWMYLIAINTAKTARGSYLNQYQPKNLHDNLDTYKDLVVSKPVHASPAESCAMSQGMYTHLMSEEHTELQWQLHRRDPETLSGNFAKGLVQFRKIIEDSYED